MMKEIMGDQLTEFLRSRKEHATRPEVDWQAKKDGWIRAVEGLYDLVRDMLRDSIETKDVSVSTFDVEDYIGPTRFRRSNSWLVASE